MSNQHYLDKYYGNHKRKEERFLRGEFKKPQGRGMLCFGKLVRLQNLHDLAVHKNTHYISNSLDLLNAISDPRRLLAHPTVTPFRNKVCKQLNETRKTMQVTKCYLRFVG